MNQVNLTCIFYQIDTKTTSVFCLVQALRGKEPSACYNQLGDEVGYLIAASAAGFVRAGAQFVVTFVKTDERIHHKDKAVSQRLKWSFA